MANIAEISVIVTGSVALGVPLVNGAVATFQAKRAARSQRLDELRAVLDDAAVALLGFMDTVLTVDEKIERQTIEERIPVMKAGLQKIWQQEARINVRLGVGHEVSEAYRHAHNCAGNFLVYARDALRPGTRTGRRESCRDRGAPGCRQCAVLRSGCEAHRSGTRVMVGRPALICLSGLAGVQIGTLRSLFRQALGTDLDIE